MFLFDTRYALYNYRYVIISDSTQSMGVFDTSHGQDEKLPEAQVAYTGDSPYIDFQEGYVTDNEDDLQRRLGNRQIQ